MPSTRDQSADQSSSALRDAAAALLANVEMTEIRPVRIVAELDHPGMRPLPTVSSTSYDVDIRFACDVGIFGNKFDYSFTLNDDDGNRIGTIAFSLVVDYDTPPDYVPPVDAADFVTLTTGYFAAYPYARELLNSLATRLGLNPIVLGLMKYGDVDPRQVSSRLPATRDADHRRERPT